MEDKTYGIKTHLVEEFNELQISRQKSTRMFVGNCSLFINSVPIRTTVEAGNGFLLHPALTIHLVFDTDDQKREFVGQLNLAENESSEGSASASSSSPPSTNLTQNMCKN
nr:PREDICTED: uncharacterized protein LOC107398056 [Tribolium castaneum]|eukprot:XP_015836281.1 PREDICTED: uncharacterized protein LOC107398056 [Tribolium castaneum]